MKHSERWYRDFTDTRRWKTFRVTVESTDLYIRAEKDLSVRAGALVKKLRGRIKGHIEIQRAFLSSFSPVERIPGVPGIIETMYKASEKAGVGPMAAVAGAMAQHVGEELMDETGEMIIENGGDIWMNLRDSAIISIYTGNHYFPGKLGIKIYPEQTPCGVCTSSGRVGPSISLGVADAATIIASCAALADAAATAAGNAVQTEDDVEKAVITAMNIDSVTGAVVLCRDRMAAQGVVELVDPCGGNIQAEAGSIIKSI